MGVIGDGLERAVQQAFTRPIPKSAGAQMRYLSSSSKAPARWPTRSASRSAPWSGT
jgi:hypothetical protein